MSTDTQAPTRIYRTWVSRIDSGRFTKAQCQQFAAYPHGKATNLTADEHEWLAAMLDLRPVRLTAEHEQQGVEWLTRYGAKMIEGLPADIMSRFSHFTYNGESYDIHQGWGQSRPQMIPVWTIHTTDGQEWRYCACAWQVSSGWRGEAWEA